MTGKTSCQDCKERTPTCHSTCEIYLKWFEANEARKKRQKSIESKHRDYFYHK